MESEIRKLQDAFPAPVPVGRGSLGSSLSSKNSDAADPTSNTAEVHREALFDIEL